MALFSKKNGGMMNVIRCDAPSYLIWKWHPAGSQPGNNKRENAIRWGSALRVKEGEVAVFVYAQADGTIQEYIEGPRDHTLETNNLPILSGIIGLAYNGDTPFQAEIYFINLARIIQVKFAVPFFDVFDPRFLDFGVPVAVRGTISFRIDDYREFIKLHRLDSFSLDNFQAQIRDAVIRYVKPVVANAPAEHDIPIVQIERKTMQITEMVESDLTRRLKDDFGVAVSGIDIGAIEIDKACDGYNQLMAVTQDVSAATIEAKTAVGIKEMQDRQRIDAENYEEILRTQREEAQYAQRKQTQTSNFAAYQTEAQAEVGVAGATALGQMGANGAGDVNLSGGGSGFNPAAMMSGMALGGAVGQNIAGLMNNMMSGVNQPAQPGTVPPPIPTAAYNVAVNGQSTGPFTLDVLAQMVILGTFAADSLVWQAGMSDWVKAGMVTELLRLFNSTPPVPPME